MVFAVGNDMKYSSLIIFIVSLSIGFGQSTELGISAAKSYNYETPSEVIELPEILHEISGLTDLDSATIACVQDELGLVFIYNLEEKKIVKQISFGIPGDYEGITFTGESLFILRSDGMLIECGFSEENHKLLIDSIQTNIPAKDNEGLCYDKLGNRLLIGCKSKLRKGSDFKNIRGIYSFDLETKELSEKPVFHIEIFDIISFAKKNGIELPTRFKKKTQEVVTNVKIGISAVAIHPLTGELFILSAVDNLLLIYNTNGTITNLVSLGSDLYQKAEGITFFENGNMLISNEGKDSKPTLLNFNYHSE